MTVGEIKTEALYNLINLAKESQDEIDFDLMFELATELYHECDIDMSVYASVLRMYADWLDDDTVGMLVQKRHCV